MLGGGSRLALFRKAQRTPWASAKALQCAWRQKVARRQLSRRKEEAERKHQAASANRIAGLAAGRRARQKVYSIEAEGPGTTLVRAFRRERDKLLILESVPSLAPMLDRAMPKGSLADVDQAASSLYRLKVSPEKKAAILNALPVTNKETRPFPKLKPKP